MGFPEGDILVARFLGGEGRFRVPRQRSPSGYNPGRAAVGFRLATAVILLGVVEGTLAVGVLYTHSHYRQFSAVDGLCFVLLGQNRVCHIHTLGRTLEC